MVSAGHIHWWKLAAVSDCELCHKLIHHALKLKCNFMEFCTILPSQQGTFPTSPLHSPVSPLLPCTALIKACFFISLELMLSPSSKRLRQWGEGSIKLIKVMSKLGFKPCQPGSLGYSLIKHSTHPAQLSSNYHLNPVALLTVLIQIVRPCPCPLICC